MTALALNNKNTTTIKPVPGNADGLSWCHHRQKKRVRKMKRITVKKARKDGKHPVIYFYEGAQNAFGGRDYGKTFNKLHTIEKIRGHELYAGDVFINQSGLPDSDFFPEIK